VSDAPRPEDRPQGVDVPARRPWFGALVVILVVLCLTGGGTALFLAQRHRPPVTVPDFVGLSRDAAVGRATAAGLTLLQQGSGRDPGQGETIEQQSPRPGATVERGDVVRVTFGSQSSQSPAIPVPDVVGKAQTEAVDSLFAAGLQPGALRLDQTSGGTPGSVTRQQPAAGSTSTPGAVVDLWIAGSRLVTVPDLTGLTTEAAQAAAKAAGVTLQILTESTDEGPPGLVFKQQPAGGGSLPAGTQMVAVVNGATSESSTETAAVPPLYETLAPTLPFALLYPTTLPQGMSLAQSQTNPRHVVGADGQVGCEITYLDATRPDVGLSLLEGNWFERGVADATTVDVRGFAASLGRTGSTVLLTWEEAGVAYGVQGTGLDEADLVAFANGLRPATAGRSTTTTAGP
jgi:beta-lactam-binding protein with PASTA domain